MNEELVLDQMKKAGLDLVTILPCDRIKFLIPMVKETFRTIDLTREEVGVGICAGAVIAGKRPAMLIQSSGAGTLPNALCSLPIYYDLPLPILVSWRGHYKEGIDAQKPMGEALPAMFESMGVEVITVEETSDVHLIGEGIEKAFSESKVKAILISPKVFEGEVSGMKEPAAAACRDSRPGMTTCIDFMGNKVCKGIQRMDAIATIAPLVEDAAVIVNIGLPCKEYYYVADGPNVFYMLGSLGLASAIGLGLAMFVDKKVVVIDGDGSVLMTPNILQHIAEYRGDDLTIIAIDNAAHGSTGNQETPTADLMDLELLARAYGIRETGYACSEDDIETVLGRERWPQFLHVFVNAGNAQVGKVGLDEKEILERFTGWLKD